MNRPGHRSVPTTTSWRSAPPNMASGASRALAVGLSGPSLACKAFEPPITRIVSNRPGPALPLHPHSTSRHRVASLYPVFSVAVDLPGRILWPSSGYCLFLGTSASPPLLPASLSDVVTAVRITAPHALYWAIGALSGFVGILTRHIGCLQRQLGQDPFPCLSM